MPDQMLQPYEGDRPYVFINYARADRGAVLPIVRALAKEGYRVWWDDGIEPTTDYDEYLADHVYGCDCLVMFISSSSLKSDWCTQEVRYALDLKKKVLPVYLEEVELTRGLQLRMGGKQALFWYEFESEEAFYRRLFKARRLDPCLTEEGRLGRGVKPRNGGAETDHVVRRGGDEVDSASHEARQVHVVEPDRPGGTSGVVKRGMLADYSWRELKELSHMIASAGGDAEGLAISRSYHLVDKDGKLQGDEKPLTLKDRTKTSVRILGFRHDELADGGKSGISFEFADVPATHRMNPGWTNVGGWDRCEMREWLNSDFLALLPDDLRASIATACKRTNNRGQVARNDVRCVTATEDRLWLLSAKEVYGGLSGVYGVEGAQYRLYADKGVTTTSYGFCKKKGADSWWWLRSPFALGSLGFHGVYFVGDWGAGVADLGWGVSPGFCL